MWVTKSRFHECGKIMLSGWPLVLPQALSRSLPRDKIDPPLSFPALTTLGSNLCNSAAPGGDYVTPMNNTHVLCVWLRYLQTLNRIVFPICTLYRSLSHGTSLEYKKWCMLWPTRIPFVTANVFSTFYHFPLAICIVVVNWKCNSSLCVKSG